MTNTIELALMSANVYEFLRLQSNRIGVPIASGWTRIEYIPDDPSTGFSAGVFERGTEIVGVKGAYCQLVESY